MNLADFCDHMMVACGCFVICGIVLCVPCFIMEQVSKWIEKKYGWSLEEKIANFWADDNDEE